MLLTGETGVLVECTDRGNWSTGGMVLTGETGVLVECY